MPAKTEFGDPKKKKKGRAPAHQNKFAFVHNPCSKRTEQILSLKNVHVCQRCSDKIEWRKKYRKYKPRTQPGLCNGCKKRNVKSAYHTICVNCTTESLKAKQVIREATTAKTKKTKKSPEGNNANEQQQQQGVRACAICVKEVALTDPEEEGDDSDYIDAMARMKLRERRSLERKIAKEREEEEEAKKRKQNGGGSDDNNNNNNNDNGDKEDEEAHQLPQGALGALAEEDVVDDFDTDDENDPFLKSIVDADYGDDENDPFLKAIGGADQLLTGEAYQRKLLQQQQEAQSGN